jgi:hypothetical protein
MPISHRISGGPSGLGIIGYEQTAKVYLLIFCSTVELWADNQANHIMVGIDFC